MTVVSVISPSGQGDKTVDLPEEIFAAKVNVPLIHQVVVAQQAAARQGSHAAKTRGQVRGGGKKPYRQKGTGRARQGSLRAPQYAGGGTAHGTQRKHRSPGSIGACATPGRVFKGVRMAGRMGGVRTTVQSLTVHSVDAERGLLLIKGAVPGPSGRVVLVRSAVRSPSEHGGEA